MKFLRGSTILLAIWIPFSNGQTMFKAKAGLGVFDKAGPVVSSSVLKFVNGVIDTNYPTAQTFDLGIFGSLTLDPGSLGLEMDGNILTPLVSQENSKVLLGANVEGVQAIFEGLVISATVFGQSCGVELSFTTPSPKFQFRLATELDSIAQDVSIGAKDIFVGDAAINIGVARLLGGCATVDSTGVLKSTIESSVNAFSSQVATAVSSAISDAATTFVTAFGTVRVPLPPGLQLDVFPGRTMAISPKVTSYSANPVSIATSANSGFEARLSQPAHRAGSSYTNTLGITKDVPEPSLNQLVNLHVSADGLNKLFEPSWYLMWSNLATDPTAIKSSLCEPVSTDSCPFPPVRQQPDFFTSFLLLLATLPVAGPMWNWDIEVVADAPKVAFDAGNIISGLASGKVKARATPLFASLFGGSSEPQEIAFLDLAGSLSAGIPSYDSATGIFSGFGLTSDIRVADAQVGGLLGFVAEFALRGPLSSAANFAFDVSRFNDVINKSLGKIPFKIPDIYLPFVDITIKSAFEGLAAETVTANSVDGSYLTFGSNFAVTSTPAILPFSSKTASGVFDTPAYNKARNGNESTDTTFTSMVYENGNYVAVVVRRTDSGEIQQFENNNWVTI